MKLKRAIIVVADSMGCGYMNDSADYGDAGADTLGHIAETVGLNIPNLRQMGLANIRPLKGIEPVENPTAYYGKIAERSKGKDTTTGHWEIAGLITEKPFPTYPNGFPKDLIEEFEKQTGKKVIGNYPASGTAIIADLGEEQMKTGALIVYTSADSVFQIAAHEEIIPIEDLYKYCEIARKLLKGDHAVSRVIARPFIGKPGNFTRTENRRDFSLEPPTDTFLDVLSKKGFSVIGVGKIEDIFCHRGLTDSYHTGNNHTGLEKTEELLKADTGAGLIFVNLVDFDMLYGHRRNPKGYAEAIEYMDAFIPRLIENMKDDDALIITADQGCDPCHTGSDHTREHVPLLWFMKGYKGGEIGYLNTYADITATIADMFDVKTDLAGKSFASVFSK